LSLIACPQIGILEVFFLLGVACVIGALVFHGLVEDDFEGFYFFALKVLFCAISSRAYFFH